MPESLKSVMTAWRSDSTEDEEREWNGRVFRSLEFGLTDPPSVRLDRDDSWLLLGWCETGASVVVQRSDERLAEAVATGLFVASRSDIDRREVMLVGALLRRACALIGREWTEFYERWLETFPEVVSLLASFPREVASGAHSESGSGESFQFERVPLAQMSELELLKRLGGPGLKMGDESDG